MGETPSFRDAFIERRCLVPADGFYEWRRDDEGKSPFWFHRPDRGILAMAGIWEHWARPGHEDRYSFAILTVDANEDVRPVHGRMPLLLDRSDWNGWLDRETPIDVLRGMIAPAAVGMLTSHRVSDRVNKPEHDEPGLIEPV